MRMKKKHTELVYWLSSSSPSTSFFTFPLTYTTISSIYIMFLKCFITREKLLENARNIKRGEGGKAPSIHTICLGLIVHDQWCQMLWWTQLKLLPPFGLSSIFHLKSSRRVEASLVKCCQARIQGTAL